MTTPHSTLSLKAQGSYNGLQQQGHSASQRSINLTNSYFREETESRVRQYIQRSNYSCGTEFLPWKAIALNQATEKHQLSIQSMKSLYHRLKPPPTSGNIHVISASASKYTWHLIISCLLIHIPECFTD